MASAPTGGSAVGAASAAPPGPQAELVPGAGVGLEEEAAMLRQSARSSYRLPLSALVIRSSARAALAPEGAPGEGLPEAELPEQPQRQKALEERARGQHAAAMQEAAARPQPEEPQQRPQHLQVLAQRQWEQHAELLAHLELLEVRQRQQHSELMRQFGTSAAALPASGADEEALRQLAADLHSQQRVGLFEMQRHLEDRLQTILDQRMPVHRAGRLSSAETVAKRASESPASKERADAAQEHAEDDQSSASDGDPGEPARPPERVDSRPTVTDSRPTGTDSRPTVTTVLRRSRDSKAMASAYEAIQRHGYSRQNTSLTVAEGWSSQKLGGSPWCTPRPELMFASLIIIFANMATLGVELDLCIAAARSQAERPIWVFWANMLFTAYFTIEMAARITLERDLFYRGRYRYWNFLDAMMVITSWVDMIFDTLDVSAFRALRVHLVLRSFRIMRFVGSLKRLRLVVTTFVHSAFTALWACLSVAVVLYTFALLILQGVEAHARVNPEPDDALYGYYGSIGRAMMCLFMAITNGREWEALVQPLGRISPLYFGLFVFYVAFAVFFILSLLTAIFVERTSQIAKLDSDLARQEELDQDREVVARIRECLKNKEGEGSQSDIIGRLELEWVLQDTDMLQNLNAMGLDASQVFALYELLADQDLGGVYREELAGALTRLKSSAKGVDIATLMFETQRINRQICALMRLIENEFSRLGTGLEQVVLSVDNSMFVLPGRERASTLSSGPIM